MAKYSAIDVSNNKHLWQWQRIVQSMIQKVSFSRTILGVGSCFQHIWTNSKIQGIQIFARIQISQVHAKIEITSLRIKIFYFTFI